MKGFSRNIVYGSRRDLFRDTMLVSVWKKFEESQLNPQLLVSIVSGEDTLNGHDYRHLKCSDCPQDGVAPVMRIEVYCT